MTDVDDRVPRKKWAGPKVHYYCAVNALLGPVYFEYTTGTTDHQEDPNYQPYMVRPHPTSPLPLCTPHRLYDLVYVTSRWLASAACTVLAHSRQCLCSASEPASLLCFPCRPSRR